MWYINSRAGDTPLQTTTPREGQNEEKIMKQFNGYESKMEYAIVTLVTNLTGAGDRSESDAAISAYTRQLNNGIDDLNKIEIDAMCHEIASKWNE